MPAQEWTGGPVLLLLVTLGREGTAATHGYAGLLGAHALARELGVSVPVHLAHQLAAVLLAEVECDVA